MPLEYVIIFAEFGFINPSTRHLPSKLDFIFSSITSLIFLPIAVIGKTIFRVIKHLEYIDVIFVSFLLLS